MVWGLDKPGDAEYRVQVCHGMHSGVIYLAAASPNKDFK